MIFSWYTISITFGATLTRLSSMIDMSVVSSDIEELVMVTEDSVSENEVIGCDGINALSSENASLKVNKLQASPMHGSCNFINMSLMKHSGVFRIMHNVKTCSQTNFPWLQALENTRTRLDFSCTINFGRVGPIENTSQRCIR